MDKLIFGVTGGTGMLGTRLVEFLSERDCTIRCLVRKSSNIENLKKLKAHIIYGDIEDQSSLVDFVKGINVCLHLAAHVGYSDKKTYHNTNVIGTENICKAILEYNPGCKLVYCSSIASLRLYESLKFLNTDYAISKNAAEEKVLHYLREHNLRADIVYSGVIYGPGDAKFVPPLVKALQENKLFIVSGGERNAPLIYIDDLCDLLFRAGSNSEANSRYLGAQKLDIGIHDFIRILAKKIDVSPPSRKYPKPVLLLIAIGLELVHNVFKTKQQPVLTKRIVDILSISLNYDKYCMDNDKIAWKAQTSIEDGLNKALEWLREEGEFKFINRN